MDVWVVYAKPKAQLRVVTKVTGSDSSSRCEDLETSGPLLCATSYHGYMAVAWRKCWSGVLFFCSCTHSAFVRPKECLECQSNRHLQAVFLNYSLYQDVPPELCETAASPITNSANLVVRLCCSLQREKLQRTEL